MAHRRLCPRHITGRFRTLQMRTQGCQEDTATLTKKERRSKQHNYGKPSKHCEPVYGCFEYNMPQVKAQSHLIYKRHRFIEACLKT